MKENLRKLQVESFRADYRLRKLIPRVNFMIFISKDRIHNRDNSCVRTSSIDWRKRIRWNYCFFELHEVVLDSNDTKGVFCWINNYLVEIDLGLSSFGYQHLVCYDFFIRVVKTTFLYFFTWPKNNNLTGEQESIVHICRILFWSEHFGSYLCLGIWEMMFSFNFLWEDFDITRMNYLT